MKLEDLKKIVPLDRMKLEKPVSEVYEEINAKCNNFLRTQRGLQYLLMKYPHFSAEHAVREYYSQVWIANNYDNIELY